MCRALAAGTATALNEVVHAEATSFANCLEARAHSSLKIFKQRERIQGLRAFELGGVFRSLRRIAGAIRMRAHSRKFAALYDQILVANRTLLEVALEYFPGACRVARLR